MKERRSPKFAILFVAALLAISTGVFFVFTFVQRTAAEERRKKSAANLVKLHETLEQYVRKNSLERLPSSSEEVSKAFAPRNELLVNPAWPERAGYALATSVYWKKDPGNTPLILENVPEQKMKLGVQSIDLDGRVSVLDAAEYRRWAAGQTLVVILPANGNDGPAKPR